MAPSRKKPKARVGRRRKRDGGRAGATAAGLGVVVVGLLVALTVAGWVVRAPPAPMVAAITFLPYLYAAMIAILGVAWVVFPDRRILPACVVGLVAIGAGLWGPRWEGELPAAEGEPVRIMSWNLRRLWGGPEDGGDATQCAISAIEAADPDVLTLLEVSRNDVDTLASALDLACVHHAYLENGGPKTGGLAACVRGERWRLRSGQGQRFVDHEDWYYVVAEVHRGPVVFNLLSVHLSPYEYVAKKIRTSVQDLGAQTPSKIVDLSRQGEAVVRGQADQSAALLERVNKFKDPTVVAGDFNSTRDSALHASLRYTLKDTWEVGGAGFGGTVQLFDWLPLRIDYVYVTDQFRVRSAEVPPLGCSDHQPVLANVILAP